MDAAYRYHATCRRVIDGDTYVFDVDCGFRVHAHINGRLRGYSAPEFNQPGGPEATIAAALFLTAPGATIVLESYRDRQSFARWIVDVWVNDQPLADLLARHLIRNPDMMGIPHGLEHHA